MSYDHLTLDQQAIVDAVMNTNSVAGNRPPIQKLAHTFNCAEGTMKRRLRDIYNAYDISREAFVPLIRLAYLRSKELGLVAMCLFVMAVSCQAQAATRPVVITWSASTSSSVTGNSVFRCTVVSPATSCVPNVTGTPLVMLSATSTTYTDQATTGGTYGYAVTATAPACTPSTPNSTPCGNSPPSILSAVPVPPQVAGVSAIVVVVP